jgi:hypothetical protein
MEHEAGSTSDETVTSQQYQHAAELTIDSMLTKLIGIGATTYAKLGGGAEFIEWERAMSGI